VTVTLFVPLLVEPAELRRSVSNRIREMSAWFSYPSQPVLVPPAFAAASTSPGISRNFFCWLSLLRRYSSRIETSVVSAT